MKNQDLKARYEVTINELNADNISYSLEVLTELACIYGEFLSPINNDRFQSEVESSPRSFENNDDIHTAALVAINRAMYRALNDNDGFLQDSYTTKLMSYLARYFSFLDLGFVGTLGLADLMNPIEYMNSSGEGDQSELAKVWFNIMATLVDVVYKIKDSDELINRITISEDQIKDADFNIDEELELEFEVRIQEYESELISIIEPLVEYAKEYDYKVGDSIRLIPMALLSVRGMYDNDINNILNFIVESSYLSKTMVLNIYKKFVTKASEVLK